MVKGINNDGDNIIKLKGMKQQIDLNKFEGLRKTEQNKPIFKRFDKNNNGILEQDEADSMRTWVADAAGNKKLSQRELKKAGEGDTTLFDSLSSLGKQQEVLESGEEFVETNGNTTTHIKKEGETVLRYDDTVDEEGNTTRTFENGNKIITDSDGKVTTTIKTVNGKLVKTEYEYDSSTRIAKETTDGEISSIVVTKNQDGHRIDTKFASQEDYDNNRPSEEITDAHNPTMKKITKFTYDDKGNVKAETTDSLGEVTTTYKDADGKEIKAEDFDKTEPEEPATPEVAGTYKVKKGEGINKIVRDAMKAQGIENPTKEQFKKAKTVFLEMNKDLVKIYHGVKREWHGNKFFYVDDVVRIPKFADAKPVEQTQPTEPVEPTEPVQPTEPTKPAEPTLKEQLQQRLGDDYIVEDGEDGKVIIKDKEGNIHAKATVIANNPDFILDKAQDGSLVVKDKNGNILPRATEMINDTKRDEEDINEILQAADGNKDKVVDLQEYKDYIYGMLRQYEIDIDNAHKDIVERIITDSFSSIDIENTDGKLSNSELNKKAEEVINKLTEDLGDALEATEDDIGE